MTTQIDENGFPIAWESGSYRILLNNISDSRPDTATLIHKEVLKGREHWARRGRLQTDYANKKIDGKIQQYAKVYSVEIDKAHREKGLGTRLYKSLLENLPSDVIGIGSHTENRSNKKEIPKIYRKLSAETFNDGDFELIKTPKHTTQIEIIEKKIEELKQEVERLKTPVVSQHPLLYQFKPGDVYFTLGSNGYVNNNYWDNCEDAYLWSNGSVNKNYWDNSGDGIGCYKNGNAWQTKELAERYGILGHATDYLREVAQYNSNPDGTFWVPDWKNIYQKKYYWEYQTVKFTLHCAYTSQNQNGLFYFRDGYFTPSKVAIASLKKHLGVL